MEYVIRNIETVGELDRVLEFDRIVLWGGEAKDPAAFTEYTREKWLERMKVHGDLMLYAEADGEVIGMVFGRVEQNENITVGPVATDPRFRKMGIARELMFLLEKRALSKGIHTLGLGSRQAAEGFYLKCGYTPYLFVQTEPPHTLEALRALNTKYPEAWSYDDGSAIRLCITTDGIDRELQRAYDEAFPGCSTQTLFSKRI